MRFNEEMHQARVLSALFLGESIFEWRYGVALPLVCCGIWLVTR